MTAKSKPPNRSAPTRLPEAPQQLTIGERLQRIESMARRIEGYVLYMCQVGTAIGSSPEATERAVIAFHEQMVVSHGELAKIHDSFKLE